MNVQVISLNREQARERFLEYRAALRRDHTKADEALMRGFRALAKGKAVLDLLGVMKTAGLDTRGRPRLAIVRADAEQVYCNVFASGAACFSMDRWPRDNHTRRNVSFRDGTFDVGHIKIVGSVSARAVAPPIPPRFRPMVLANYHVLWEAEWETVPRDPILLRRLHSMLFAVLAQWDLTDLERAVLKGQ